MKQGIHNNEIVLLHNNELEHLKLFPSQMSNAMTMYVRMWPMITKRGENGFANIESKMFSHPASHDGATNTISPSCKAGCVRVFRRRG